MSGPGPQRGTPEFASDQRTEILRLLREAGSQGVSKEVLIFDMHMTQCGARVWELEQQGYQIRHESRDGERYVTFVLVSEPTEPKPLPAYKPKAEQARDDASSGSEPEYARRTRELHDKAMPLFATKVQR